MSTYATKIHIPKTDKVRQGDNCFYELDGKNNVCIVTLSDADKDKVLNEVKKYRLEYHRRHYIDAYDVDEDEKGTEEIWRKNIILKNSKFHGVAIKDGYLIDKSGEYRYVFCDDEMTSDRHTIYYLKYRLVKA